MPYSTETPADDSKRISKKSYLRLKSANGARRAGELIASRINITSRSDPELIIDLIRLESLF